MPAEEQITEPQRGESLQGPTGRWAKDQLIAQIRAFAEAVSDVQRDRGSNGHLVRQRQPVFGIKQEAGEQPDMGTAFLQATAVTDPPAQKSEGAIEVFHST